MSAIEAAFSKLYQGGYEPRSGQLEMAQEAWQAFQDKHIAVLEGATGIGKTFAYLIAGLTALQPKQKMIVATATVTLQEQLINKDLPTVLERLNLPYSAALAKGRRRYVCPQKLYQAQDQQQFELSLLGAEVKPSAENHYRQTQLKKLQTKFKSRAWSGDLDHWPDALPGHIKQAVTTDAAGCTQQRCPFFQECPYFEARRKQQKAEVIVTNHHLLLADMEMGTGSLLPEPEKCLYVIDEAHHFPQAAVEHFQSFIALSTTHKWLQHLEKSLGNLPGYLAEVPEAIEEAQGVVSRLIDVVTTYFPQLTEGLDVQKEHHRVNQFSDDVTTQFKVAATYSQQLYNLLGQTRKACIQDSKLQQQTQFQAIVSALAKFIDRLQALWRTFHLLSQAPDPAHPPVAKWFSFSKHFDEEGSWLLHAAMTSSSNFLPQMWWDKIENGLVLCSATLRSLDSFDYYLQQTGLNFYPNVACQAYQSDFDYQGSTLCIPKTAMVPVGTQLSEAFIQSLADTLESVFKEEDKGCLVLFTSDYLLRKTYEQIQKIWHDKILCQHDLPKNKLLEHHKKRVEDGEQSILFGLQSLAEGVDLPGDYCRHVVITRLPFAVPSTPIEQTWYDWLESQGKNPFFAHTLPQASIKLTQYAGRLLRRKTDTGTITIFDKRIVARSYGKFLLANLPPFRQVGV